MHREISFINPRPARAITHSDQVEIFLTMPAAQQERPVSSPNALR